MKRVMIVAAAGYLAVLILGAMFAPQITQGDPTDQNLEARLLPAFSPGHLLGTDNFGRDVFTRVVYGARSALLVGFVSVGIALSLGLVAGLAAGWWGRAVDEGIMLVMDGILAFPVILLAITVVSFLGYGLVQVMTSLGLILAPVFARIVRAETLAIKQEPFVEASRALGSRDIHIIIVHILPNIMGKVAVQTALTFAAVIVIEASLSYLGLGTQPPNPSWGLMLQDARNFLYVRPGLAVYPGLAIALSVLSLNVVGDVVSEALNPTTGD